MSFWDDETIQGMIGGGFFLKGSIPFPDLSSNEWD